MRIYHRHVIALLAVSVLAHCAVGSTYRVATNGTQITPYDDWSNAFSNIHDAVDYATDGDTLLVTNGLYSITQQIVLTNGITLLSANGAEATIIDAGGNDRCLFVGHPEAVVDGFTICNGDAENSDPEGLGGGAYIEGTGTVQNCTIVSNSATEGGGVYINLEGVIDRCVICDNATSGHGAGIYFYRIDGGTTSGGYAKNCLITGNTCGIFKYGGGAFFSYGGHMDSCTIAYNQGGYGGGAYGNRGNSTWSNSIVYFNTAIQTGDNCARNGSGGVGTALCTTPSSGTDCQTNNPRFLDAASGDYRLLPGSPCIDNGQSNGWMATSLDLAGNARIDTVNMANDIGAYEYQIQTLDCGFSADSTEALAPATITFYGTASGTDTNGVSFLWDFDGDGSVDAQGVDKGTVSREYDVGTYTVSLLVTNASGDRAARTNVNYISIAPAVTFVSQTGTHTAPYTNSAMASTNLQDAIDECMEGSLVWVADGRYGLTSEVVVAEGVRVCSINGANSTILDGNDSVRCVYMQPESELDGFTITRGGNGGMYIDRGTVSNCVIVSNNVTGNGGGTYSYGAAMLSHCRVQHNAATGNGGGMFIETGLTVRNCLISDNTSEAWGGGVYFLRGGSMENCTVTRNEAVTRGGGILQNQGGGIYNSIIYGNTAPLNAERDVYSTSGMYYNYCCTTPSVDAYGSGNITNAPVFKSPSSGNYRISWADSPCVDTGATQLWMSGAVDLDGFDRICDAGVDMGAYESRPPSGTMISIH